MPAPATIAVDLGWLARHLQNRGGTATLDDVAREAIRQQSLGKPQRFLREAVAQKLVDLVGDHGDYSIEKTGKSLVLTVKEEKTIPPAPCPDYPPPLNQPALFTVPHP